ncbi:MAG: AmmeMemoRadiSam system protein A, partial [Clostridiales bacterium]|nr:AmmeMemoRadiSam system protein A [Clostridiales bacterium]
NFENDHALINYIFKHAEREGIAVFGDTKTNRHDHGSFVPMYFIAKEYKNFKFLRLGLSGLPAEIHYRLGRIIAAAAEELNRRTVYIASGDLSHVLKADGPYGFKEVGPKFDAMINDILGRAAFDELLAVPAGLTREAAQCGLSSFRIMAGALDGEEVEAEQLSYEGTFGVGYAVFRFSPTKKNPQRKFLEASAQAEKEESATEDPYIALARQTIEEYIRTGRRPELPENLPDEMTKRQAACFVSLHREGQLRGCIGTLEPCRGSLALEIQSNAISASTKDPRFQPLRPEELEDLDVSVDVLFPAEKIQSIKELDPKRYGVIVSSGLRRGVLLPNLEGIDTAERQVEIARRKAGIAAGEAITLERFEVVRHE